MFNRDFLHIYDTISIVFENIYIRNSVMLNIVTKTFQNFLWLWLWLLVIQNNLNLSTISEYRTKE